MEIYFATNRNLTGDDAKPFGTRFHQDGPHFYRVGVATVEPTSDDYEVTDIHIQDEAQPEEGTRAGGIVGSEALFAELRARMQDEKRDILIFIHGFANTFEETLKRAAQLKQQYLIDPNNGGEPYEPHTFAFSWPANGNVTPPWEYFNDRDDAAASGVAMARSLKRLIDFLEQIRRECRENDEDLCKQRFHLVTHSMGNWALRHAIQGIRTIQGTNKLPRLFDNAFLMAADEDEDAFEHNHKFSLLSELARAVHVYHSANDIALTVSDVSKANPDRLGHEGPRTFSGISARINAIDCTNVSDTGSITDGNHQYYRLRPEVIADVRQVLKGDLRPDEFPNRVVVEPNRRYRL